MSNHINQLDKPTVYVQFSRALMLLFLLPCTLNLWKVVLLAETICTIWKTEIFRSLVISVVLYLVYT